MKRETSVKRLFNSKLRSRLGKESCLWCNEKWLHDHGCKVREDRELIFYFTNKEEDLNRELRSTLRPTETVELKTVEAGDDIEIAL